MLNRSTPRAVLFPAPLTTGILRGGPCFFFLRMPCPIHPSGHPLWPSPLATSSGHPSSPSLQFTRDAREPRGLSTAVVYSSAWAGRDGRLAGSWARPLELTALEQAAAPRSTGGGVLHEQVAGSQYIGASQMAATSRQAARSTWSAVISLTSRAGELRSAPSGPDDRDRVAGKRALAPGVRVRRARAVK